MPRMPGVRFVVPRSFSRGRPAGPPRWIIIHYTAGSEGPTAAEDGVAYDQRRTDGTSAHFYTDRDSVIQCVDTNDRSHTALRYGNYWGIHIEQCGTVQTRAQWLDPASRETIRNTAKACAWALKTHGLPLDRIVTRELRSLRGLAGHKDVTLGFPEDGGTHMDPDGSRPGSYPYDVLLYDIRQILYPPAPTPAPVEEDDMPKFDDRFTLKYLDPETGATEEVGVDYGTLCSLEYQQRQTLMKQQDRIITLLTSDAERESNEAAAANALLTRLAANTEPPA